MPRTDQLFNLRMSWFRKHYDDYIKWRSFDKQINLVVWEELTLSKKFCESLDTLSEENELFTDALREKKWLKYEREGALLKEKIKKLKIQREDVFSSC